MTIKAKALDFSKPVQTRSGMPVKVLCTDANIFGEFPVVGIVTPINGSSQYVDYWRADGSHPDGDSRLENIRKPIKLDFWLNVYDEAPTLSYERLFSLRRDADITAEFEKRKRLACVPVTIHCCEGDGLENT